MGGGGGGGGRPPRGGGVRWGEPLGGNRFLRWRRWRCDRRGSGFLGRRVDWRRLELDGLGLEGGLPGGRDIDGSGGLLLDLVRLGERDREVVLDGDFHSDLCPGS